MIFILDNFDSFTYNLYQYFGELGEEVVVWRRDQCTLSDITNLNPELIVISPGPCTPDDSPLTLTIIEKFKGLIPILGVCLGHQAIGQVFGAMVVRAKIPMHGKISEINHDEKGVFSNLPNPLKVTRYHSLVLKPSTLPEEILVTAQTNEGEIMGIRHRDFPIEGVQFHPEAILTEAGHALLSNAVNNARQWLKDKTASPWQIRSFELSVLPYRLLPAFRESQMPFFLDSGEDYPEIGRYSFLGAWPFLQVTAHRDATEIVWSESSYRDTHPLEGMDSLKILDTLLGRFYQTNATPFPFAGGAVGFFSYDLKDELEQLPQQALDDLEVPLWRLAWYDGIVIYDHQEGRYWLTACGMNEEGKCSTDLAGFRLDRLEELLKVFAETLEPLLLAHPYQESYSPQPMSIELSVSREKYLRDLQQVIDYIFAGDIYQANLTQRFSLPFVGDPWRLYQDLHVHNPAPFAAFLPYNDFQVLCSSPERFLQINSAGKIETRPIKGTRPRGDSYQADIALAQELQNSLKDRAELTMIIDLERNDLGRISHYGSVSVKDLIRLERYPTVWHLVSTITGQVKENLKPSEVLAAVFPGGSITGAPKIRAMEIIEGLEPFKRGIYTGSIGYLGFDGAWDLNIVIRTILLKNRTAYLHAGGGIVADSVPENEYEEAIHKAQALFTVLGGRLERD
ncbi:MAG: aminodeoxychorismate synthase component I [Desulfitobacteriaceae bacterium]